MKHTGITIVSVSLGFVGIFAGSHRARAEEVPFAEHVITTAADGATSVFAADVDGDGDTDILSSSRTDNTIAWYENDGGVPPTFIEHMISTNATVAFSVFATDLDGDGDTDVLSASRNDNKIRWYESDGATPPAFTERVISMTADAARSVFAIDMNGDGDTDVVSASRDDDKIAWYESDGGMPPTFTERVITVDPDGPGGVEGFADGARSIFATDVDGDGDIDVLSASKFDHKIAWYESSGGLSPTFTARVITTNAMVAVSVYATDMDGDGDVDVVSASFGDNKIRWHESDGGMPPAFTEREISSNANEATAVFAADVNGDGDIDVVSSSANDNKIAWYESDGATPPTFTERIVSTTAGGASFVFAADVDGDGDIDAIAALFDENAIAWYENTPPAPIPTVSAWGLVVMSLLALTAASLLFRRSYG